MRVCLALMFTNELPFLKLHVPVTASSFDGIVAYTDPKTTDGSLQFMNSIGAAVVTAPWQNDWGWAATLMINYAKELGYDGVCRIDPDEMLMPDAGNQLRYLLEYEASLLVLPRYEFFGDRLHYRKDIYPDWQARAFRLNKGIIIQGKKHEGINFMQHGLSEDPSAPPERRVIRTGTQGFDPIHIYHYGHASPEGIRATMIKYWRYGYDDAGMIAPDQVPDDPLMQRDTWDFEGEQPLNPAEIGIYAPYEGIAT